MTGSSVSSSRTWRVCESNRALLSIILLKQASWAQSGERASAQTSHLCPQYRRHISFQPDGFSVDGNTDMFPLCAFTPKKKKSTWLVPTHRYPGMVAGAAGNEDKSPTPLDLFDVVLQSAQDHWKANRTANPSFCSIIFHLIKKGPQRAHESAEKECFNKTITDNLLLHILLCFFLFLHVFKHNDKKKHFLLGYKRYPPLVLKIRLSWHAVVCRQLK